VSPGPRGLRTGGRGILAFSPRGRRWSRLEFDLQILLLSILAGLPAFLLAAYLLWNGEFDIFTRCLATAGLLILWVSLTALLRARLVRPIQTLSSVLAALREGEFSLRARVPRSLKGPLASAFQEANMLETVLREQRLGAVEATALLRRVLEEIDVAVFAFDADEQLRLLNRAAERLLGRPAREVLEKKAADLRLDDLLSGAAPRTLVMRLPGGQGRWELKRTVIRQDGAPLKLVVLSDLARALREEERQAWKRIIRVLSHEINNSLAPITSIAASLATLMRRDPPPVDLDTELGAGLKVIAGRAESLGRFMADYAKLARLPLPSPVPTSIEPLVARSAALETRLPVEVRGGPPARIMADPDQLEHIAAGFAFSPVLLPAAAPERHQPLLQRPPQRLLVHVAQHQHLVGGVVLHDGRDQPVRLVLQLGHGDFGRIRGRRHSPRAPFAWGCRRPAAGV